MSWFDRFFNTLGSKDVDRLEAAARQQIAEKYVDLDDPNARAAEQFDALPDPVLQGQSDEDLLVEACRIRLRGVRIDIDFLKKMEAEEAKQFLASVHRMISEPAWVVIRDGLMSRQVELSINEAEDWEQTKYGRATILGISLVDEELKALDAQYLEINSPKEKFDRYNVT